MDLLSSIELIFKSQACLNGSFLLDHDRHFGCSSRNHGLDLKAAQLAFDNLRVVENESIKQVVGFHLIYPFRHPFNYFISLDLGQYN